MDDFAAHWNSFQSLGLILALYGLDSPGVQAPLEPGVHVNLYCGIMLLLFGGFFFGFRSGRNHRPFSRSNLGLRASRRCTVLPVESISSASIRITTWAMCYRSPWKWPAISPSLPRLMDKLRVYSRELAKEASLSIADIASAKPAKQWSDYVFGVAQELSKAGFTYRPCDMYIASQVPAGSGLKFFRRA